MKAIKKIITLLAVFTMLFAVANSISAEDGTITITPPSGVDANATNSYKIYKVFDAVANGSNISYKLVTGKTTAPTGFSVDSAGNVTYTGASTDSSLTAADIAAFAGYVTEADLVDTATSTGSANAVSKSLPNGYYYIATSTGTVVTIDSTKPTATVIDKNTVPTVDKKITGASSVDENGKKALAQVGTTVNYSAVITVGNGAKGYVFHDKMETGLTYNNDATVTEVDATNYTVGQNTGDTFTITFKDDYLKTLTVDSSITITYSATVNDDAITTDPLNNTCYVSYGDANSNYRTPNSEADVYEAKFTVTKHDDKDHPLADAGFVIKNAAGKYYKITDKVVSWVDSINDATEYTSDTTGAVTPFSGLANGTYTLVEKTVPSGYKKAADQSFTVTEHVYTATNLEKTATVTNAAGSALPSTGGIGTTIFHVTGAALAIGAAVLLISKKRMNNN